MKIRISMVALLFLFMACSKENQEELTGGPGKALSLSVSGTDELGEVNLDSLRLYCFAESSTSNSYEVKTFPWSNRLMIPNLLPESYRFIAVATSPDKFQKLGSSVTVLDNLKGIRLSNSSSILSEDLCAGVVTSGVTSQAVKLEMKRLVGGVKVNVTCADSILGSAQVRVYIGPVKRYQYIGEPYDGMEEDMSGTTYLSITDSNWHYTFPSEGVVYGKITVGNTNWEHYAEFDFMAKHAIEAGKKLELNFTLTRQAASKGGAAAKWGVELTERVMNF